MLRRLRPIILPCLLAWAGSAEAFWIPGTGPCAWMAAGMMHGFDGATAPPPPAYPPLPPRGYFPALPVMPDSTPRGPLPTVNGTQ